MGRTRKPLSEQIGNLTKQQQERRLAEQALVSSSENRIEKPPAWLDDEVALKEYKRLAKAVKGMDILGDLDKNNLAGYCNAFSKYLRASHCLAEEEMIVDGKENPLIAVQIKYAKEMREFARLCGLSIDSRLKFAAVKLNDIETDISDEFGDI